MAGFCGPSRNFREALECGSLLPLWRRQAMREKSARGLAQSKTLPRGLSTPIITTSAAPDFRALEADFDAEHFLGAARQFAGLEV